MGTEEEVLAELRKLNSRLDARDKPKEPRHIPVGRDGISGVSIRDIAEGLVVVDLPQPPIVAALDQERMNASIADLASGKLDPLADGKK